MTSPKEREPQDPKDAPDEGPDLDAEIVRDLELDGQAEDVRGGHCPTSQSR